MIPIVSDIIYKNLVVCSPENYRLCRARYPNKNVHVSPWCPNKCLYYFNRAGKMRRLELADGSVWESYRLLRKGLVQLS